MAQSSAPVPAFQPTTAKLTIDVPPLAPCYRYPFKRKHHSPKQFQQSNPQVSFSNFSHQSWYNFDQKTFAEYEAQLQETDTGDEDYFPVEMQEPRFLPFDHDERMEAARISNLGMIEPTGIYLHHQYQQQIPIQTNMFSYENEEDLLDHYQEMEELQLQAQGFIAQNQAAVPGSRDLAMVEIAEDELVKIQQLHKDGKEKLEKQELKDAEEPEVEQKVKNVDKPEIEEKLKQEEKDSKVKVEAAVASAVNISEYGLQLTKQEMPYNYVSIDDLSESESGFGFRFGDGSGTGDFVDISLSDERVGVSGTKADANLGVRKSIFGVLFHGIHRRLSGILPSCLKKGAKGHKGPPIINPRFMNSL